MKTIDTVKERQSVGKCLADVGNKKKLYAVSFNCMNTSGLITMQIESLYSFISETVNAKIYLYGVIYGSVMA